jgi:DNA primase
LGSSNVSHSLIHELLSQIDIVDIVSHYITLKRSGRNFVALCPFHSEKTPSFVVSQEKQIFKCFGCGVGGNAITFVQKYENLSFWEAVKRVSEIARVELPKEFFKRGELSKGIEESGLKAAKFFNKKLTAVKEYLLSRGIDEETANEFLLGYAPSGYVGELKIPKEEAQKLGLVNSRGGEFFRNRLMIPIFSHSGNIVGFAGRALSDNQSPKYINTPETEIFKKSSILYGFFQSKEEIVKKREVVIVEGYFDVISLHKIGVKNVVAPMGTSLTEKHASFLKRYSQSPILMFDGDSAGTKAAIRSAGLFFKFGCEPKVVQLPKGEDPDSMARKQPERVLELLSSPKTFIDWAVGTVKSSDNQVELLKQVVLSISELKTVNPFLFKEYFSVLSAEFGVDEAWLKVQIPRKSISDNEGKEPVPHSERAFLRALFEGWEIPVEVSPNIFVSSKVSKLYSIVSQLDERNPTVLQSEYPELSPFISEILLSEFTEGDLKEGIRKVLEKEFERRLKRIRDFVEKRRLKRAILELKKGNFEVITQLQTT